MAQASYQAIILDLDGVITQTASLHAQAWERMFNDYLQQRAERESKDSAKSVRYKPFDPMDYRRYVDGKPRYDGVYSFLDSRDIDLPWGTPDDSPTQETVCGLGNRKNELFLNLVQREGVDVYSDATQQIRNWRSQGLKTAVVSSSRNCVTILETAGLLDLFDTKVDGVDSATMNLNGKPAPDIFLQAARQLEVDPQQSVVIEDAIAGVEAGHAGQFGLVVGVARNGNEDALKEHGANCVVHDLTALHLTSMNSPPQTSTHSSPSALTAFDEIAHQIQGKQVALFTDYDGTLTPIVRRPENAVLTDTMRSLLQRLANHCTVAIISGRDLADVKNMVKLDNLYYAGSHGFDIAGPGDMPMQQQDAAASLPDLDKAERQLRDGITSVQGVWVERKRFAIALHYREAPDDAVEHVEAAADKVLDVCPTLRKSSGKKIVELQPNMDWDKGRAIRWIMNQLDLNTPQVVPIYLGDDTTDEDGFRVLSNAGDDQASQRGIGIRVGTDDDETEAAYVLPNPDAVQQFLQALLQQVSGASST